MTQLIDLTGRQFGRLKVVKREKDCVNPSGQKRRMWLCLCDCGELKVVSGSNLRSGSIVSCGCWRIERAYKHGHSRKRERTKTYRTWKHMNGRCRNPKDRNYKHYGGRGIKVCESWQGEHGYENFLSDMGECPQGKTLDRYPNNNGNYEPSNCRWATNSEQHRNTRRNIWINHDDKNMVLSDWAKLANIDRGVLRTRLHLGWSMERALSEPVKHKRTTNLPRSESK